MNISLEFLKQNCKMIHSFGLGFIQIKLNDTERVHIYTPKVKITTHPEEVHDHRYSFTSEIIKGRLTNDIFQIIDGNDFVLTEENCSPHKDKNSIPKKTPCNVKLVSSTTMEKGSKYFMDKDTLHRVSTDRCITFLSRESTFKDFAKVVYPKSIDLSCPFSVNMPENELWNIAKEELSDVY